MDNLPKAVTLYVLICRRCGYGRVKFGAPARPQMCTYCGYRKTNEWDAYTVAALPVENTRTAPDSAQHTL